MSKGVLLPLMLVVLLCTIFLIWINGEIHVSITVENNRHKAGSYDESRLAKPADYSQQSPPQESEKLKIGREPASTLSQDEPVLDLKQSAPKRAKKEGLSLDTTDESKNANANQGLATPRDETAGLAVVRKPNKSPHSEEKPRLILLVGPPKTATTTIQRVFCMLRDELEKDGYMYEGRNVGPCVKEGDKQHPEMLTHLKGCRTNTSSHCDEFAKYLDQYHKAGSNVIMVDESLACPPFHIPTFKKMTADWRVEVIINYHRLFEWLPSFKNQAEKPRARSDPFPSEPKSTHPLPWLVDRRRPSGAPEFFQAMVDPANRRQIPVGLQGFCSEGVSDSDRLYEEYKSALEQPNITMLSLYEKPDVTTFLLCNHLLAKQGCKAREKITAVANPSSDSVAYQLIAIKAIEEGLYSPKGVPEERHKLVRDITAHHTKKLQMRPFPLECTDSKSLEALLEESLRLERKLVPDKYDEDDHRKSFAQAVAKKKFCSVNTTAILSDPDWLQFFQQY